MAITLEQVEKLREKSNVSYEDAKSALEQNRGDLLEALIYLERQGRTKPEGGGSGGFFTTQPGAEQRPSAKLPVTPPPPSGGYRRPGGHTNPGFWAQLRELLGAGRDILRRITVNQFEVWRGGQMMTSVPVLILVILLIVAFYIIIPLIITGLFFGCRYRFSGPDLGKDKVNNAMGTVSDTVVDMVDKIKREMYQKNGKK